MPELQGNYQPKNLICNFRAPDVEHYELWQHFKEWCKDNGLDICRVTLDNVAAFMKSVRDSPVLRVSLTLNSLLLPRAK